MSDKEAAKANIINMLCGQQYKLVRNEPIVFLAAVMPLLKSHSLYDMLTVDQRRFLPIIMVELYSVLRNNSFFSHSIQMNENAFIDCGIFNSSFFALLNHSCVPNVAVSYVDDEKVISVISAIKKGDQLFISYG